MHLMQDELDFVAGWSSSINITAGTARKDDTPTRLNRVGPVLRVFKGKDGHGRSVETMQYIGCGACDTKGQWAALICHTTASCASAWARTVTSVTSTTASTTPTAWSLLVYLEAMTL